MHVSRMCSCDSMVSVHLRHLVFPSGVVIHVQHSCSRFEDGGCCHSRPCILAVPLPSSSCVLAAIVSSFSSACCFYMSEVSFQLLWVDIFVFGVVQGFVNVPSFWLWFLSILLLCLFPIFWLLYSLGVYVVFFHVE